MGRYFLCINQTKYEKASDELWDQSQHTPKKIKILKTLKIGIKDKTFASWPTPMRRREEGGKPGELIFRGSLATFAVETTYSRS